MFVEPLIALYNVYLEHRPVTVRIACHSLFDNYQLKCIDMQYRKEIDGLRAIAVLPVILFHAGIRGFSGGYVGVDIFFVISGYLITSIILEEKSRSSFSVINFYERRARRILPALSTVLFFTTVTAFILMPADLLKSYSQSLLSVATFFSNVFFYLTSGYFSTRADEKPLLHTWSLAVEEQYYLFFPLMIVLFWSIGKKRLIFLISISAALSLFLSHFLSSSKPIANFYLIFSRAWELFSGSLIAFLSYKKISIPKRRREALSTLGLFMIFFSILFIDKTTPFPSFYTLIPVIGTCFIIFFSNGDTTTGRFLSSDVLVFIGLLSYSLYLWHQPVFAFIRLKHVGAPPPIHFIVAIVLVFICSFLSWKYIETPFRDKKLFKRSSIFRFSAASIAVFFVIGLVGYLNEGFENRFDRSSYAETIEFSPKRNGCHTDGSDYLKPEKACSYFGENITWASFGDSHTIEPAYALAKKLEAYDMGLVHLSFSGCPPALLFDTYEPGCSKWAKEALQYLESNPTIKNVLLGYRYSEFLFGDQTDIYPNLPDQSPSRLLTGSFHGLSAEESRELYFKSFSELVTRLLEAGKNVYILYPIPELPVHITKAVTPLSVFGGKPLLDLDRATTAEYYFKRNQFIISKLDSLPFGASLHAVKPFEILCDGEYCPAVGGDKALYFDDNHLSISGAMLIAEDIMNKYQKAFADMPPQTATNSSTPQG